MAGYLKDELEKIISNQSDVWLIETDEVKNFKFYFISYNAGTLEYLNRKQLAQSIFAWRDQTINLKMIIFSFKFTFEIEYIELNLCLEIFIVNIELR